MRGSGTQPVILPVTGKQKHLLELATNPDCPEDLRRRSILAHAFLIAPKADMRRLRRAVQRLSVRHDLLRLRFEQISGVWRAAIDPVGGDVVRQVDLGDVDEATFMAAVSEVVQGPMPITGQPLFEVHVISAGLGKDAVVIRLHFAITDGYGMAVLIEDFIKSLLGLPILSKAMSFEHYMRHYRHTPPHQAAEAALFWDRLHATVPRAPDVGRKAQGLAPNISMCAPITQQQLDVAVTPDSLQALERQVAQTQIPAATLMYCAYLEAISACYGVEALAVMTHVGRSDPALSNFMGNHTRDMVLPFVARGADDFLGSAAAFRDLMPEMIAHAPRDAGGRGTLYDEALIQDGLFLRQFALLHPRRRAARNTSFLSAGFQKPLGEPSRIGAYTVTRLKTFGRRRLRFEMLLEARPAGPQGGFTLHFDAVAYGNEEIRAIATQMCALLGLELCDMTQW